jgi:hypothetical protein
MKVHANTDATVTNSLITTYVTETGLFEVQSLSDFHTEGSLYNQTGSTIDFAGTINIAGDLINDAFITSTGHIIFNGNSDQHIGGTTVTGFEDFTVNKSGGDLIFDNDVVVNGTLTLTQGIVVTGGNVLNCVSALASDIAGYNSSSFIYGNLQKSITSNTQTYPLPVGKGNASSEYHLAEFINNNLTGVTALTVRVQSIIEAGNNVDANLDPIKAVQDGTPIVDVLSTAEWEIIPTGVVTSGDYGINLYVDNISNLSSADDFEFCVVKRSSFSNDYFDWDTYDASTLIPGDNLGGRTFITYDGFGFPIGSGYAQRTGYTAFSKFAIAKSDNTPLPVELLSFTGELIDRVVVLNWITLVEINNDYFTIEKISASDYNENMQWEGMLDISGAGNSNWLIEYSEIDDKPYPGKSYYRLKQTDYDGRYEYAGIIQIDNSSNGTEGDGCGYRMYPNPSLHKPVQIENSVKYEENIVLIFELFEPQGKMIFNQKVKTDLDGNFSFTINNDDKLCPGIYFLSMTQETDSGQKNQLCNKVLIIK